MSLETNLKRKIWLRSFRYNINYRTIILFTIIIFSVSITIYGYHYTQTSIIEELEALNELDESNRLAERFKQRREHLKEECSKFGLDQPMDDRLHTLNAWEFLISNKYQLVYCNVFKAASSSWLYNFNLLAGVTWLCDSPLIFLNVKNMTESTENQYLDSNNSSNQNSNQIINRYTKERLEKSKKTPVSLAREKYSRPSVKHLEKALDQYLSFVIVRHPFERLVSAYVDKFIKHSQLPYFIKIAKKIIKATRSQWQSLAEKNLSSLPPEMKKKIEGLDDGDEKLPPTFEELVRYIICEKRARHALDEHWTPMTSFCTPCLADFDIIMKFETLEEDQNYLIELAKLEGIIKPQWKNPTNKDHRNVSKEYFSQLSVDQLEKLISVYKYDFELFEYSPDPYFNFVNKNVTNFPCFTLDYKYL